MIQNCDNTVEIHKLNHYVRHPRQRLKSSFSLDFKPKIIWNLWISWDIATATAIFTVEIDNLNHFVRHPKQRWVSSSEQKQTNTCYVLLFWSYQASNAAQNTKNIFEIFLSCWLVKWKKFGFYAEDYLKSVDFRFSWEIDDCYCSN